MSQAETPQKSRLKTFIILFVLIIAGVILYARFIGTKGLRIKEYIIESPRLAANFNGLKIVHFTDLHYGTTVLLPELENLVAEINLLKPHIIIFTGDLIDSSYAIKEDELEKVITTFNKLAPEITGYIIRGNHDLNKEYENLITKINLRFLKNEHELFYYKAEIPLAIVGLDDLSSKDFDSEAAFAGLEETDYYTILLAHEPDVIDDLQAGGKKIDLFLSGHSHNGQVRLPFVGAVIKNTGAKRYYDERYQINETETFISGGIGTTGYPFRLFNRPSFNFYRFAAE